MNIDNFLSKEQLIAKYELNNPIFERMKKEEILTFIELSYYVKK